MVYAVKQYSLPEENGVEVLIAAAGALFVERALITRRNLLRGAAAGTAFLTYVGVP